jgi:predicted metal-dependent peptidase
MEAREKISKAIIQAMDCLPFYAELLMRARILPFPEKMKLARNFSPSICVSIDGNIYFDEDFINGLPEKELNFIILHEAAHKAYLHLTRIGKRDALIWNVAADIVVDYEVKYRMLQHMPYAEPPQGRIIADRNGDIKLPALGITVENVDEKDVEMIYAEIAPPMQKKMKKQGGQSGGNGKGDGEDQGQSDAGGNLGKDIDSHRYATEDGRDYRDLNEFEQEEIAERAKDDVIEAATKCKKRGTLPKGVERMLDKLLRAKINWRQYIYKHIVNDIPYDQTLTKPNRRFITQGLYVPGILKENLELVAMVDLSGSINEKEMSNFISWMQNITNQFRNVNITILSHDSEVQAVTELRMADARKIQNATYEGGGGTDHVPCFEWVKDNKRNCPLIIAFTDGYTRFPQKSDVRTPTIWVISRDGISTTDVPFGVAIKMEDD